MGRIHKGDIVEVIAGNDRGKRGRVLRVVPDKNRVVVEGVNLRWKHMRKSQQAPQGGRIRREMPVHFSNVMLFDEAAQVRSRIGYGVEGGKKVRLLRKSGKAVGAAPPAEKAEKAKKKTKKKAAKETAKKESS
ncbi:MAG: 50S ribosomal protein L24 [Planctomycetota bacterium]|jgi:large subunit ribosomal protein L24